MGILLELRTLLAWAGRVVGSIGWRSSGGGVYGCTHVFFWRRVQSQALNTYVDGEMCYELVTRFRLRSFLLHTATHGRR